MRYNYSQILYLLYFLKHLAVKHIIDLLVITTKMHYIAFVNIEPHLPFLRPGGCWQTYFCAQCQVLSLLFSVILQVT